MSTTALTVLTETTNPATHAMNTFHAAMEFYLIRLVNQVKANLFCGTTLREDVITIPILVIQHIYYIEEIKTFLFFCKLLIIMLSSIIFVH